MLVFHSLWDAEKFYLWAESSLLPLSTRRTGKAGDKQVRPHPFALAGSDLSYSLFQAFPEIKDMIHDLVKIQTLRLRLPAGSVEPLPSPWLLRDDFMPEKPSYLADCTVSALALDPGQSAALLLDLPLQPRPATAYADSMRFWFQLSLFSLELVSRQQFLPALHGEPVHWRDSCGVRESCFHPRLCGRLPLPDDRKLHRSCIRPYPGAPGRFSAE